jgi:membrane protease YdiL (CAAX protease family)
MIPFFGIGLLMCWLFYRQGNLWESLIFHVLFNGTSTAILIASR